MKESRREFAVNSPEQSTGPGQPQPRPYSFTFYLLLPYHPQSSTGGEGAASAISTASWAGAFPFYPPLTSHPPRDFHGPSNAVSAAQITVSLLLCEGPPHHYHPGNPKGAEDHR